MNINNALISQLNNINKKLGSLSTLLYTITVNLELYAKNQHDIKVVEFGAESVEGAACFLEDLQMQVTEMMEQLQGDSGCLDSDFSDFNLN